MEDKRLWIQNVETLLRSEPRSYVDKLEYSIEEKNGWKREVVKITYNCGSEQKINVSGNSLGAILHEIVREVYGQGAIGRIFDEY
jgi:hypothetical protein